MACGLLSREGRWGYPRQRKWGGRTTCLQGLGVAGVGRTLTLGRCCASEPAHPPSALPERHSGPSPGVRFQAPHHSCRPHRPQGLLPSLLEDLIPHSPTSLPQGWAPQLRASPSQTQAPSNQDTLHPTGEGKDLPRVPSWGNIPKNKGASRPEGALWGPRPAVGDAGALLQPVCAQGALLHVRNQPLTLTLPGAHVPSFLSSASHGRSATLQTKLYVGQIGENLPLSLTHLRTYTHRFWSPRRHSPTYGRLI